MFLFEIVVNDSCFWHQKGGRLWINNSSYNLTPLDICTMDYPKFIVSYQKEESISIQRINNIFENNV